MKNLYATKLKNVWENLFCFYLYVTTSFLFICALLSTAVSDTNGRKSTLQVIKICSYDTSNISLEFPARERIVGGEEVTENEFPWHVGITSKSGVTPFCGGTLISDRFIVTAAHCLIELSCKALAILIGYREYTSTQGIRMDVEKCLVHPNYNPFHGFNDIAIAKIAGSVDFQPSYFPVCFPRQGMNLTNQIGVAVGWGLDKEGGKPLTVLNKVQIPIISMEKCIKAYGKSRISSSMICAGSDEGGKSACQGDSGGSLMIQIKRRWYIVGVISWGRGCARPGFPNVFTRIDKYYNWIIDQTKLTIDDE